jgi:hypothetical protein
MGIAESDTIINAAVCSSDILSFVRISPLNWIGHVNRMDSKRKVSTQQQSSGKSTKKTTKKQMVELCTDINNCKIKNWK